MSDMIDMIDIEYDYDEDDDDYNFEDNYDEDEDSYDEHHDNCLRINGHLVEDLEDIKDYNRGIMLAEKMVDYQVACMGCTVFQQKGYDSCTESASWTVRIMLEEEENNIEATGKENNSLDTLSRIVDNYSYFL